MFFLGLISKIERPQAKKKKYLQHVDPKRPLYSEYRKNSYKSKMKRGTIKIGKRVEQKLHKRRYTKKWLIHTKEYSSRVIRELQTETTIRYRFTYATIKKTKTSNGEEDVKQLELLLVRV